MTRHTPFIRLLTASVLSLSAVKAVNEFANLNLLRVQSRLRVFRDMFNPNRAGIAEAVEFPYVRGDDRVIWCRVSSQPLFGDVVRYELLCRAHYRAGILGH